MPQQQDVERVLVTGATGFVGFRVVAALLEIGIQVTVLVRPEQEDKLASLAQRVRVINGDIWNRGSLKGLARGQQTVVHLVGSTHADPSRGLT
jgi:dihydroflavonol-4-reductase